MTTTLETRSGTIKVGAIEGSGAPAMDAYVTHPVVKADDDAWPGIVFFMDGIGLRDVLFRMADRLASHGYFVIVPNMYWRSGAFAPFDPKTVFAGPGPELDRLMTIIGAVTNDGAKEDTIACFDKLAATKRVRGSAYGTTGYCLGGGLSLRAAVDSPSRVACAMSFHGGRFVVEPDAPELIASNVKCPIYIGVAEIDRRHTPEITKNLEAALAKANVPHEVELFAGKSHGWCVPDLPPFDEDAAEKHWSKTIAFFEKYLR